MAAETGLTQNAIVRIWHAFGLPPHRVENVKFAKDPQFVEKVRDIVGLYLNPPDRAVVGSGVESNGTDSAIGSGGARSPVP
jgi:hypothetical protein